MTAIESAPENKNGVILYETTLSLSAGDLVFLNGMTAEIEIVHNDHKQALLIPSTTFTSRISLDEYLPGPRDGTRRS